MQTPACEYDVVFSDPGTTPSFLNFDYTNSEQNLDVWIDSYDRDLLSSDLVTTVTIEAEVNENGHSTTTSNTYELTLVDPCAVTQLETTTLNNMITTVIRAEVEY